VYAHNGGREGQNGALEDWRVYRPVVADSNYLDKEKDPDPHIKVRSWIRIHTKVMRICNPANDPDNCNVLLAIQNTEFHHFDKEKDPDPHIKVRSWIRIHIKVMWIRNPENCKAFF
jgi:hypothetical protein